MPQPGVICAALRATRTKGFGWTARQRADKRRIECVTYLIKLCTPMYRTSACTRPHVRYQRPCGKRVAQRVADHDPAVVDQKRCNPNAKDPHRR